MLHGHDVYIFSTYGIAGVLMITLLISSFISHRRMKKKIQGAGR